MWCRGMLETAPRACAFFWTFLGRWGYSDQGKQGVFAWLGCYCWLACVLNLSIVLQCNTGRCFQFADL